MFLGKIWILREVFIYAACRDVFPHILALVTIVTQADFSSFA